MLDDKDIEKLGEVFATKEDIKNLSEVFATKEDIKNLNEVFATKEDVKELLGGQDEIIEKLSTLLQEKTIGDEHGKRQKKVLEIHHGALKKHKMLSTEEVAKIENLQAF